MITAGIDIGIENIKAVILKDGKVIARGKIIVLKKPLPLRFKSEEQLIAEIKRLRGA